MTTPRIRALVSFVVALTVALPLGGCVTAGSRVESEVESAQSDELRSAIRFDNDGREYVHVYLVGLQREWLLGRVEPGARATLRIPDNALAPNAESMRLAVLVGDRVKLRAAAEPLAVITIVAPLNTILAQQWTFSQSLRELTSLPLGRRRPDRR
jgi:hypothetical protein